MWSSPDSGGIYQQQQQQQQHTSQNVPKSKPNIVLFGHTQW